MIMRFESQIIDSAIRFRNMSPPLVNDVARFASPTGSGVLPRTLPSVIFPVGLAAMTLADVALNGAASAVVLLQDVGVAVGTMPVSVVRSRSIQVWTSVLSFLLFFAARPRARSDLQSAGPLGLPWPRSAAWPVPPVLPPVPNTPVSWL